MNLIFFLTSIWFWIDWFYDESKIKNGKLILAIFSTPTLIYNTVIILSIGTYMIPYLILNTIDNLFPNILSYLYNYNGKNNFLIFLKKYTYCDNGKITILANEYLYFAEYINEKTKNIEYWIKMFGDNTNDIKKFFEEENIDLSIMKIKVI